MITREEKFIQVESSREISTVRPAGSLRGGERLAFQKPPATHNTLQRREIWRTSSWGCCINHTCSRRKYFDRRKRKEKRTKRERETEKGRKTTRAIVAVLARIREEEENERGRTWMANADATRTERRALKNATVANLVESFQSIDFIGSLSRPRAT